MRKCLGRDIYEIMTYLQDEKCRNRDLFLWALEDMMPMITETLSRVADTLQDTKHKCTDNLIPYRHV